MDGLAIIGVSQVRGGVDAVAALQERFPKPEDVKGLGFPEAVIVSTCNRFEAVVRLPSGMDCREARRRLGLARPGHRSGFAFQGEGALEHLCRVAASLESVNPGEDQVMRQVRAAFAVAKAAETTGPVTSYAFQSALQVAKRVRREVPLAPLNTSLFTLALPTMRVHLRPRSTIAVVGVGEMGKSAARALYRSDLEPALVIINRDEETGRRLAGEVRADWLPLQRFLAGERRVDAVVCATPRSALLDAAVIARLSGLRLIVDLGVPRNVDAASARRAGAVLVSHDELQAAGLRRRAAIAERLAEAESVLLDELDAVLDTWTDRQLAPAIRRLRLMYRETIGESLPSDEATALAHRFAHVPVKGLRALARRYGLDAATTFLSTVEDA